MKDIRLVKAQKTQTPMAKITLFAQILQYLPKEDIRKIIREHDTDKHSKGCDTWTQLISMIFCQFADCVSLRDTANGMHSAMGNLNHLGVDKAPSKSTLGYQNKNRSSEVFRDIYYKVLEHLGQQVVGGKAIHGLKTPVKLLDSTLISLCMELYDWALYTHTKGAVKLHTLLDFRTFLPEYVHITDGKGADNSSAWSVRVPPHSIVVADRGYCDFGLLNHWDSSNVTFVVRHKDNLLYRTLEERDLPPIGHQEVLKDEIIELTGTETAKKYGKRLRRVAVFNEESNSVVQLLTNDFKLAASTIAALYKARWNIEIFFRNLKQNFHIKSFVGTTRNAVEIQIWTALTTMLLLSYMRSIAKYPWHFSNLVHSLRLNTFTKLNLLIWLDNPFSNIGEEADLGGMGDTPI